MALVNVLEVLRKIGDWGGDQAVAERFVLNREHIVRTRQANYTIRTVRDCPGSTVTITKDSMAPVAVFSMGWPTTA